MKIAISCHPTQGGSGIVATELAKQLAAQFFAGMSTPQLPAIETKSSQAHCSGRGASERKVLTITITRHIVIATNELPNNDPSRSASRSRGDLTTRAAAACWRRWAQCGSVERNARCDLGYGLDAAAA